MRILLPLLTGLCVALGACGGKEPAPAAAPEPAAPAPKPAPKAEAPKPAEPAAPAGDNVDDAAFEVRAVRSEEYAAGKVETFSVEIVPKGHWHLNQDFPTEIHVSAGDDVSFPKAALSKADAAEFGEEKARFDVPFTAKAAGSHDVSCKLSFAVCTEENCVPEERTLAVALQVQ
jgi:hypothetical protein